MPDIHSIVVEIDPAKAKAGYEEVDRSAAKTEREAVRAAKEMERALVKAAQEAARAAADAARQQEEHARHVTQTVERQTRERSQAEREASRVAATAAQQAARAQEQAAARAAASAKRAADEQAAANKRLNDEYRAILGPAANYAHHLQTADELLRRGAISTQLYQQRVRQLQSEMRSASSPGGGGAGGGLGSALPAGLTAYAAPAAAVGATLAIGKEVLDLSDSYQVLSNKIRVVTDDETAMARVRDQLFDIAERTRSSNEGVVTVYTRLAASAKELGRTDQQLLQFTESLSKAVKISGATSAEASAGLIQLSQGLASGALRGDELRSVLEQLPAVADVIAQGLGVTRGELRKMGEDGKITANAVIDAFEKASGSIDERFGKSVATTSDLMQVLHNEIERTVGSLTEQINLLPTLAKGFEAAGAAIRQMGEAAHVAINYFKAMDAAIPEWVKKGLLPGLNGNAGKAAQVAFSGLTAVPWDKIATDNLSVIDATIKHALAVQAEQQKIIDGQEILDAQARKFFETDSGAQQRFRDMLDTTAVRFRDAFTKDIPAAGPHVAKVKTDLTDAQKALVDLGAIAIDAFDELGYQADLGVEALQEFTDQANRVDEVLYSIRETAADVESGFADGLTSFGASITDALGGNGEDAPDQKIKKIKDEIDTLGEVLAAQGGNVLVSGIDAFVDSINGAEVSFREFAQSVLADLEKMLIKFLAFQAIKATIGVADGSIGSILAKSLGFAAGGSFTVPGGGGTDSVPVYFRATPGERVTVQTPGQMPGGQGGGAVINSKVVVVDDRRSAEAELLRSSDFESAVLHIVARSSSRLRAASS